MRVLTLLLLVLLATCAGCAAMPHRDNPQTPAVDESRTETYGVFIPLKEQPAGTGVPENMPNTTPGPEGDPWWLVGLKVAGQVAQILGYAVGGNVALGAFTTRGQGNVAVIKGGNYSWPATGKAALALALPVDSPPEALAVMKDIKERERLAA